MTANWFVRGGGKVYGPLDSARLKQLVIQGKIDQRTEVAQAAAGPWHPAGSVKGLFPASGSAPHVAETLPQHRNAQRVVNEASTPASATANKSNRPQKASGGKSFASWYQCNVGGWNKALQLGAWLFGGYVFFPLWWALSGNVPLLKIGKLVGIALVALFGIGLVMEFADPEGMKQARERRAQAAAERRENAAVEDTKKGAMKGAHVAAGLCAIEMKNNGAVRPRGDVLNALARKAANDMDVPSERRAEFVRDFEWAFNLAWDKSN